MAEQRSQCVRLAGAVCMVLAGAVGITGSQAAEPAVVGVCSSPMTKAIAADGERISVTSPEERAARHLLDIAGREIEAGRSAEGCELLVVVAKAFSSTQSGRIAAGSLWQGRAPPVDGESSGAAVAAAGDTAALVRWREIVVRATGAQDELREAVGDRVFFSVGSAEISSRAAGALNGQAGWLIVHGNFDVVVEGHAGDGLAEEASRRLAVDRAEAVRQVLIERGVAAERIAVLGLGSAEPVAACDEQVCLAQNRRAVTRLVPADRAGSVADGGR